MSRIQSWLAAFVAGALFSSDWGPFTDIRGLWGVLLTLLFLLPALPVHRRLRRGIPVLVALILGVIWSAEPREPRVPDLGTPVPALIEGRVERVGVVRSSFPRSPTLGIRLEEATIRPLGASSRPGVAVGASIFLLQPWSGGRTDPLPGERVRVEAMVETARGRWRARSAAPENLRVVASTTFTHRMGRLRGRLSQRLKQFGDSETGAMLAALILGMRDEDPQRRAMFRRAGASHFLVVSGLHLGLMAALLHVLTRGRRRPTLFFLGAYALLAGGGAPVMRALLAVCVLHWANRRGLAVRWAGLLAALAAFLLVVRPARADEAAFRLSFQALAGVLAWAGPTRSMLPSDPLEAFLWRKRGPPPSHRILRLTLASVGAVLATAPVCLKVFGGFAPAAVLSGLLFPPLVMLLLALGALTLLIPPAVLLAQPVVAATTDLAAALSFLPGGFLTAPSPAAPLAWLHYALFALGCRLWAREPSWRNLAVSLLPPVLGLVLLAAP